MLDAFAIFETHTHTAHSIQRTLLSDAMRELQCYTPEDVPFGNQKSDEIEIDQKLLCGRYQAAVVYPIKYLVTKSNFPIDSDKSKTHCFAVHTLKFLHVHTCKEAPKKRDQICFFSALKGEAFTTVLAALACTGTIFPKIVAVCSLLAG